MRRRLAPRSLLLMATAGVLCMWPAPIPAVAASTPPTQCASVLPPGTYGDIVVPPNARCDIDESVVTGSIRVLAGAQLFSFDSVIHGSIVGEGAASTRSSRNTVAGNFVVRGGGPAPFGPTALLCGTTLGGNALIQGTTGGIGVRSAPIPGFDPPTAPVCGPNRISGNLVIRDNTMTRPLIVRNNVIGGNAVVANNRGPAPKSVTHNTVRLNLVCTAIDPPFDGGSNSARHVIGQCSRSS